MTYTRIRCERSEQQSHAKRVIESGHHQIQKLLLDSKNYQDPTRIHKAIVEYQFQEVFQPHWFGSIQWQPFITDYATAVKEARHFRNKFYCALLKTKPTKIPNPPGETLENPADPRDNSLVIAGYDWVHRRQAARIR